MGNFGSQIFFSLPLPFLYINSQQLLGETWESGDVKSMVKRDLWKFDVARQHLDIKIIYCLTWPYGLTKNCALRFL